MKFVKRIKIYKITLFIRNLKNKFSEIIIIYFLIIIHKKIHIFKKFF